MKGHINPKVVGATIVGFALIAGAYTVSNFSITKDIPQQASVSAAQAKARAPIAVLDNDNNGIEDWRDEFITTEPIFIEQATSAYTPPDTLTGELGVNFMEGILNARVSGPFGRTNEEVIDDTVNTLDNLTAQKLYDTPDVLIIQDWEDQDIVNYANTVAEAILDNNLPHITEGELFILYDILTNENTDRVTELNSLAESYKRIRDVVIATPAPIFFAKQHLDLINSLHAIHKDIEAMAAGVEDPALALLRLKRYEDDATGLRLALGYLLAGLEKYSSLFNTNDPALLFTQFSPNQIN
jgi:hypothetical protein